MIQPPLRRRKHACFIPAPSFRTIARTWLPSASMSQSGRTGNRPESSGAGARGRGRSEWIQRMVTGCNSCCARAHRGQRHRVGNVAANAVRKLRLQVPRTNEPTSFAAWCALGFAPASLWRPRVATRRASGDGELGDDPTRCIDGTRHAVHAHYPDWPLLRPTEEKIGCYLLQDCNAVQPSVSGDGRNWRQALG